MAQQIKPSTLPKTHQSFPKIYRFFDGAELVITRTRALVKESDLLLEDLEALLWKAKGLVIGLVLLIHTLVLLLALFSLQSTH